MTMKIKECEPWEAMKASMEGKRVAVYSNVNKLWAEKVCEHFYSNATYGIIEESELVWNKFDWDFFNQYGGIWVVGKANTKHRVMESDTKCHPNSCKKLIESPWYSWSGGEQPVPDNVEVEVVWFDKVNIRSTYKNRADELDWDNPYLLVFRLTGEVL